jgi:hypothetical protein
LSQASKPPSHNAVAAVHQHVVTLMATPLKNIGQSGLKLLVKSIALFYSEQDRSDLRWADKEPLFIQGVKIWETFQPPLDELVEYLCKQVGTLLGVRVTFAEGHSSN